VTGWLVDAYPWAYPWIRSFHIISMVAWMAGLLYLPRLYVYHSMVPVKSDRSETFQVMERRLLRGIMNPAMIATWLFGWALALTPGVVDWRAGWIWGKLALVIGLTIFHGLLARWRTAFSLDSNMHSTRFFRAVNELPSLALIGIVLLVVVKPF
jgi:protoporphyrinogen IX oxidase